MRSRRIACIGAMMLAGAMLWVGVPAAALAQENTLTLALESDPTNIDPRFGTDVNSARVYQLVSNALIRKDPHSNLVPDLAERWENPDDKTYVFYLRKGVKFHDGSEFTAEDVKYTFESMLDPESNSPKAYAFKNIKSIQISDPYTITFRLNEVSAPFLLEMVIPIVPKKAAEQELNEKFTETLIGTGPFKLVSWTHDQQLVFKANRDYYSGPPKIDTLVLKIIPDDTVRFLELKQGNVDLVQNAIPPDMIALARNTKGLKVLQKESVVIYYLGMNLHDPILRHVKVRQALAHAIDRQSIVDYLMKGQASLATGLLSPANWAYEKNVTQYDYDVEAAKRLLDEAGYPDPDGDGPEPRFKLAYKTSTAPLRIRIGEVLQDQLKRVGIEITEIQTFEWAKFYADIKSGDFQLFSLRWVGITEPDIFYSIFHSKMVPPDGRNRGRYANTRIDELVEKGRRTLDLGERKKIYSNVQKILAEELPYVYLWYPHNIVVMNERVHGFTVYPDGDFASIKDVWVDAK
ncbi:ABC transporter substrate-binding protein [candidate division KSB3 bacterium]|uniref:ABC transporter substrate-binding protein n=1 Tax=candidate division KSB3 bacterium TaxID=2044937 RepID=A0A2G6E3S7_9BACT|nr:MAG: ABC transporter substrate-binding protein [candidate division KSB3 bacterium]PIE29387.1 MAG: ABC transporter substrate-binding protein [candidate division KSB3 bacterium]